MNRDPILAGAAPAARIAQPLALFLRRGRRLLGLIVILRVTPHG